VSVKFDPFSSIKLSLVSNAEEKSTSFEVQVVLLNSPRVPIEKHTILVNKFGNAGELLEATAQKVDLEINNCILVEIYSKKIYKIFEKNDAVDSIGANDTLVLYELPGGGGDDVCELVIHARQEKQSSSTLSYGNYRRSELLGIPFPTFVSRKISGKALFDVVKSEYTKRLGTSLEDKWRLCRTTDKFNVSDCKEDVSPDDETLLDLGARHYVVAEFDEEFEVPEVVLNMFAERSYSGSRGAPRSGSIDLIKCFQMFTETDKLSPQDTWYCSRCQEHREAYKKMELWSMPPVLVLQLKRFTYTTYSRDRLDTSVAFPIEGLDLRPLVLGPDKEHAIYDLSSVSKHMGGLGGGHYVAYARSSENGKWYYYNDSSVSESSPEEVANDQVGAYVLFYVQRHRRPASWA